MKKILLVDDEEDILNFLSYHFRKIGFSVTTAEDGVKGLLEFDKEEFDIIISDIRMPNMGGVEMCTEMKKRSKSIPFLFLTAVTDDYKILYAMMSGADQIVDKPIKLDYLTSVVNGMLEDA